MCYLRRTLGLLTAAVVIVLAAVPRHAIAQEATRLQGDTPIRRTLAAGEAHEYTIALEAGWFAFVAVEQDGIDVIVRVRDPEGVQVAEVDSPNGTRGIEPILLFTESAGDYRIDVRPLNADAVPGRYTIGIERREPTATTPAGRVDQLFAVWDRPGSPGAAIGIMQDGEVVFTKGYGEAQIEYGVSITPETVFHVASVSKQFTAFAVILLADRGLLSLDDDIRKYLPELYDFGHTITIRHLIHHTSGLRDQWDLVSMGGWRMDDVITHGQIMRILARQRELNFPPGEEMVYCNSGYTLLAEIVARVSGKPFPEFMREQVFEPLGMRHTHFHDDHEMIVPNRAYSYGTAPEGFRNSVLSYANVGATSLFTTVGDALLWMRNLDAGTVGGPRVLDVMHQRAVLNSGDTLGYGGGLSIGEYRGLRLIGHSGGDAGFRSYIGRFPDRGLAVAIFSNLGSFDPAALTRRVADVFLEGQFPEVAAPAPASDDAPEATEPPPGVPAFDPDTVALHVYTGRYYSTELETAYSLVVEEGRLTAVHVHYDPIPLTPVGSDRFSLGGARVVFERDASGAIIGMRITTGRVRNLLFERVDW